MVITPGLTVAICGLGGLGSNIAILLARAGIGRLILIDFDRVDITNLHRQQYKADQIGMYKTEALAENLKEIAPYISLQIHTKRITEQNAKALLSDADIICEAFDGAEAKAMLAEIVLEREHKRKSAARQAAEKVREEKNADAVSVLIMNPKNGEIMAMVNVPEFNLNDPFTLENTEIA